ncbi:hypothetical protein Clacol_008392 [Clathrus columnatus]|uniref:F-box domain-containing protein n=1 Tax=Clathrus columnatus TaxID=1419009 RepID=A0AAV5ALY4_9AGAM|nr:hypothetical protein Clacol_008392 [Clathrus columnatus]
MSLPQIQSSDSDVITTTSTSIPSFMDKLPLEVCQIIFEYSLSYPHLSSVLKNGECNPPICEGESTTPRKFVPVVFHSRTVLCLVSKKWREWIYGTPTLWSTIIIYAHIPPSVEIVKRWCLLSGSCPLDIYADPLAPRPSTDELQELWDMPTPRYHHGFRELVDLFRINCFRIRRLVVTNWDEIQTPLSLIFPANSIASQLEVLAILRYTQIRNKSDTPIFDNVHAPNLHTLCMIPSLWSLASGWCPSLRSLSISAEGLRPASFQSLSSFSCLEYLEIQPGHPFLLWNLADWLHWHDSQTSLEIALPTLKHISIAYDPTGLTSMILKHMKSENLISVTYRGTDGEDNTLSALRDLPGINHVRYLKLEGLYFGKDTDVNVKENFLSLNVIHLVESFVDQDFYFELMNIPHASPKKNTSKQSATPVFNDDEHVSFGKTKGGRIELEVEGITYYLEQQRRALT